MKTVPLTDAQADLEAVLKAAEKQRIVLTRDGKPCAILVGVESYDEEQLRLASSPEFWRMIEERRQSTSAMPLASIKERLEARDAAERTEKTKKAGPGRTRRQGANGAAGSKRGKRKG
jgi:prevent-host-death family protein